MALAHRWADRNLSRIELAFALALLVILIGVFLGRGLQVMAMAEAAMVRTTQANLDSALRFQFYRLIINNRLADSLAWTGANPITLLQSPATAIDAEMLQQTPELARFSAGAAGISSRYLGEFSQPDLTTVPAGMWYFDSADQNLVYIVRNKELFRTDLPGVPRIRFRTELEFNDLNGDGKYNPGTESPTGVGLELVEPYEWIGERIDS